MCVLVAQSCPILCNPTDCSPSGSSVLSCGILQARILEWVAILFSRGCSWPRDWTQVSCTAGRFFTIWATREAPVDSMESPFSRNGKPKGNTYSKCIKYIPQSSGHQPFWHKGLVSLKIIFPRTRKGVGMVWGWFKHITFIVHFISNLMLSLI